MIKKLIITLFRNLFSSVMILLISLVFAKTIQYLSAWITSIIYFILCSVHHILLFICNKKLFLKRIDNKETNVFQRNIIYLGGIYVFILVIISAISYKNNFLILGLYKYIIAFTLIMLASYIYINVLKVNHFLSATINNKVEQNIIQEGAYSIIRHPMYIATSLYILGFCVMLGSLLAILMLVFLIPLLVLRIINEEKILLQNNREYENYMKKVKYRLVPFIW